MIRVYIDFDSTLYETEIVKKRMNDMIADAVLSVKKNLDKETLLDEVKQAKTSGIRDVFGLCKFFEEKYGLEKNYIKAVFDEFLANGEKIMYPDSIPFLERLSQKDCEINILTYTAKEGFAYQMQKLMGSGVLDYVDNFIICSRPKGELELDYENAYFFDDNPKELISLFKAGVSEDRLFRIRRDGVGYSLIDITEFKPNEHKDFADINL